MGPEQQTLEYHTFYNIKERAGLKYFEQIGAGTQSKKDWEPLV